MSGPEPRWRAVLWATAFVTVRTLAVLAILFLGLVVINACSGPAQADDEPWSPSQADPEVRFEPTPGGEQLGLIVYDNRETYWGMGGEIVSDTATLVTHRIETPQGTVVLQVHRTKNNSCEGPDGGGCPDMLEVVETPPGTIVVPAMIELPEETSATLRLVEFLGL